MRKPKSRRVPAQDPAASLEQLSSEHTRLLGRLADMSRRWHAVGWEECATDLDRLLGIEPSQVDPMTGCLPVTAHGQPPS